MRACRLCSSLRRMPARPNALAKAFPQLAFSSSAASSEPADITGNLLISGGYASMALPLPTLPGLTNVRVPLRSTVKDLVSRIRELDDSVKVVEVQNGMSQRVAASTHLADVAISEMNVVLGDVRIRLLNPQQERAAAEADPEAFAKLKAAALERGPTKMSQEEWQVFCRQVVGHDVASTEMRDALAAVGVLALLDRGESLLLVPSATALREDVVHRLLREDETTRAKLESLSGELAEMQAQEAKLTALEQVVMRRVVRNGAVKKTAVLTFMTAQFGGLAYLVYEVYSWDVMEPACYFLMLSYAVGASVYFALKRRDANYDNLLRAALERQRKRAGGAAGYDENSHAELKEKIERHLRAVNMLRARLGEDVGAAAVSAVTMPSNLK